MSIDGRLMFSRYLDSVGDGTGTKDMSTTADDYMITAQTGQRLYIARMLVGYQDGAGANVSEYGNLNAALSNGIEIKVLDANSNVLINLTDNVPIKANGHWSRVCYDYAFQNHGGGDDIFAVRWTFEKSGRPIILDAGESLVMEINDDLTNLVEHYAIAQGYFIDS